MTGCRHLHLTQTLITVLVGDIVDLSVLKLCVVHTGHIVNPRLI